MTATEQRSAGTDGVQFRRWGRIEIAVFLSGVAVAASLLFITDQGVATLRRDIPLATVAQEVELNVLQAHQGMLEVLGGDTRVNAQRDVFDHLDAAGRDCRTLLAGGQTDAGWVAPLDTAQETDVADELCRGLVTYRDQTVVRLTNPDVNGEGTAFDDQFDAQFRHLVGLTQELSSSLGLAVSADAADLSAEGRVLAGGLLIIGLAVAMLASRRRRELAVQNREFASLAAIVKSTGDAIMSMSLTGEITSWNPAAEVLYGYRADEIIGRPASVLVPAELDVLADFWASGGDADVAAFEFEGVHKDGSLVPISVTMSRLFYDDTLLGVSVVARDVSESHARELELATARNEALDASRLKSQFLATMSHEIRTPLNGVMGLNGLLLETPLDEMQRQYAEGVQGASDSLLAVINDILEFSRLEAGRVDYENAEFDPRLLVEDVAALLAVPAHTKNLELLSYCTTEIPGILLGDAGRIRQVLLNLAGNAVKFTGSGEVAIIVKFDGDGDDGDAPQVLFEVRDTGIGIATGSQERLFESFSQADASTTRRYGGSGLGLAICQRLVDGMGGRIGVESEVGIGSRFWFRLPLASIPGALRPSPLVTATSLLGLRVLVVDDNATNRLVLVSQLTAWGMCPEAVSDARSALLRLSAAASVGRPYEIAVLDHLMPDMDGLELARRISADPHLSATRMIMLSSSMQVDKSLLSQAGVQQWCTKPVRTAALHDRLTRMISGESTRGGEPGPKPARAAPVTPGSSRGRILVVEDNGLNQLVAEGVLTKLGYQADIVANGVEALVAIGAGSYAAVLMDCHMPVMDGFEATKQIRSEEAGARHIPILAMTASVMDEDRERCLAAGMDDYLTKPVNIDRLNELLELWVFGGAGPETTDGPATASSAAAGTSPAH